VKLPASRSAPSRAPTPLVAVAAGEQCHATPLSSTSAATCSHLSAGLCHRLPHSLQSASHQSPHCLAVRFAGPCQIAEHCPKPKPSSFSCHAGTKLSVHPGLRPVMSCAASSSSRPRKRLHHAPVRAASMYRAPRHCPRVRAGARRCVRPCFEGAHRDAGHPQVQQMHHKLLDIFFSVLSCIVSVPFYMGFLPPLSWNEHWTPQVVTLPPAMCSMLCPKGYLT
jgi:hypothetical protein